MLPFVTDVTSDGLITLGFPESLSTTTDELADADATAIRKLSSEVSMIKNDGSQEQYEVFEAIEIKLSSTEFDDLEPVNVEWSLQSFTGQEAEIQMDLDKLRRDKIDTEIYDNMSITFNDASGTFVSENGKGINFGESIQWSLKPLVKKSMTIGIETLGNFWLSLILISLTISFFLAIFSGSLVSTWMLINSLQLIAHLPLIANRLPSNAHYFLLNFLGLVRFNFASITAQIDTISGSMDEAKLLNSGDGFYNAHLRSNGYHFSFFRNMMLLLSMICIIGLVWIITAILQSVRSKIQ